MGDRAFERTIIRETPQRIFDVITDYAAYPRWANNVKDVAVVRTDEDGPPAWCLTAPLQWAVAPPMCSNTSTARTRYECRGVWPKATWCADSMAVMSWCHSKPMPPAPAPK